MMKSFRFKDREHAGKFLAQDKRIQRLADENPIIFALPRGGVPVAYEIANAINAPLDVLIVRKLGVPYQPEVAFGAISLNGVQVLHSDFINKIRLTEPDIISVIFSESKELERRNSIYRGDRPFPAVKDRTVLIVDDGIATGATLKAAIMAIKQLNARKVIAIAPVGPKESVEEIGHIADDIICPHQPDNFHAVGLWYEHFPQTTDQEVINLLNCKTKEE